jgi:putative transposase
MNTIALGSEVIYQGMRMRVDDTPYNGTVVLVGLHDESDRVQASLQDLSPAPAKKTIVPANLTTWDVHKALATAAREIIKAPTAESRKRCYVRHAKALGVCKRTLERAVNKIRNFDAIQALSHGRSGRRIGTRLLSLEVEAIINQKLQEEWLVRTKPNLSDVVDHIRSECRKQKLAEPCYASVRRRAHAIEAYHVLARREGSKKAKYALKAMVGHIEAALARETVQIDHTLADIILVSDNDRTVPIGRPWVTLAIDVATRMVVGVYVTFESPSAISVALCLVNAILPKEGFLKSLGIRGDWPVQGVMQTIHLDNAREFHSAALQNGCSQLGIDIQYRPVGSPHYGGIVERLIGTLMGRCRLLPGATQSNVVKRGEYDAEAHAVMTLTEFRSFFVNEIVNVYHTAIHRTLSMPPLAKWRQLSGDASNLTTLPAGWENWMLPTTFYPSEERLVGRSGIQFKTRFYWNDALKPWVGDKIKRPIFYDPGDDSKIFIVGPSGVVLIATDTRQRTKPASFAESAEERARARELGRSPEMLDQRGAGLEQRTALRATAKARTKQAHRDAAKQKGKAERANAVPVSQQPVPSTSADSTPPLNFNLIGQAMPVRRIEE